MVRGASARSQLFKMCQGNELFFGIMGSLFAKLSRFLTELVAGSIFHLFRPISDILRGSYLNSKCPLVLSVSHLTNNYVSVFDYDVNRSCSCPPLCGHGYQSRSRHVRHAQEKPSVKFDGKFLSSCSGRSSCVRHQEGVRTILCLSSLSTERSRDDFSSTSMSVGWK